MNKTVTLIVPCYNEEESLPIFYRAVCDVARGLPQYQISLLFVNDGSKDGTLNVMRNLAAQDERVKFRRTPSGCPLNGDNTYFRRFISEFLQNNAAISANFCIYCPTAHGGLQDELFVHPLFQRKERACERRVPAADR